MSAIDITLAKDDCIDLEKAIFKKTIPDTDRRRKANAMLEKVKLAYCLSYGPDPSSSERWRRKAGQRREELQTFLSVKKTTDKSATTTSRKKTK